MGLDRWPEQIMEVAKVVVDRQQIAACAECGHRARPRERYCFNCGRTLRWPPRRED